MISYTLFSYFEALEPIIREIKGPFSMMTLYDLKVGVKDQFDTCKRSADHDFQEVVLSFQTPRTMIREMLGLFDMLSPFDIKM